MGDEKYSGAMAVVDGLKMKETAFSLLANVIERV